MSSIFTEIRTSYNLLSSTQKTIADYILSHTDKVILLTISELADQCNTSETTVIRFLKKLGYSSYQVFRVKVAQEIAGDSTETIYEEIKEDDTNDQIKRKVIFSTVNSIKDLNNILDDDSIEKTVDILLHSNRIIFYGVGSSSAIASDAFHKFSKLALNVSFYSDPHFINIINSHLTENDVLFVISHSGESREILNCTNLALVNNAKVIAITSYKKSTLAKLATVFLLSSTNETKYRSDAMISRIIQLVIIDIIYISTFLRKSPDSHTALNKSRLAVAMNKT